MLRSQAAATCIIYVLHVQTGLQDGTISADIADLSASCMPIDWCLQGDPRITVTDWLGHAQARHAHFTEWCNNGAPRLHNLTLYASPQGLLRAFQACVAARHVGENWSLETVTLAVTVCDWYALDSSVNVSNSDATMYVNGISLVNALWDTQQGCITPLLSSTGTRTKLPILCATVTPKSEEAGGKNRTEKDPEKRSCSVPIYSTYERRPEDLVFNVTLPSLDRGSTWALRGIAGVCAPQPHA